MLSIVAMFAAVAFVALPLTRDIELKTQETFAATGIGRLPFLFGRLGGGFLFALLSACAAVLGTLVATYMPWLDQERIAPLDVRPYWFAVWAVMLPNLLIVCSLVAVAAALTRSLLASYTVLVAIIIAYVVVSANTDQETIARCRWRNRSGASRLAKSRATGRCSTATRCTRRNRPLLVNRLIWLSVAGVALAFAAFRFRFAPRMSRRRRNAAPVREQPRDPERDRNGACDARVRCDVFWSDSFCRRFGSICAAC